MTNLIIALIVFLSLVAFVQLIRVLELSAEIRGVDTAEITDEDNNEICEKCGVKSVPSFLLFKDRTYIDRTVGANIKNLKEMIENIITNKKVVKD